MHVSQQVDSRLAERVPAFLENRWQDVDAIAALDHANDKNGRILGHKRCHTPSKVCSPVTFEPWAVPAVLTRRPGRVQCGAPGTAGS